VLIDTESMLPAGWSDSGRPYGRRAWASISVSTRRSARSPRSPTQPSEHGSLPLRILVYSDSPAIGGAEVALGYLLQGLDPAVDVGGLALDRTVGERIAADRAGTTVCVVPAPRSAWDLAAVRRHGRAIRAFAPDIVHANQTWPLGCSCGEVAALVVPGVRVLAVHHLPLETAVPRLRRLSGVALARALDAHVAVGERVARIVERYLRLPAGSVRSVPNGVPSPPVRIAPSPQTGELRVGALGRLTDQKRIDGLVRALSAIPNMRLTLVGDGPQRRDLERLASALGVAERLEITGWVNDPRAWLPRFNVLAVPSLWEGMPLAILEAMHAGLPVVASDVGSVAEAVSDEQTGFVVPPGDDAALVDRLRCLQDDPELRRRMGESAKSIAASRFTVATMARGYEAVYRDLLARPPMLARAAGRRPTSANQRTSSQPRS
jgi:glycosyltransferase involved in cell wall biosynthesis